MSPVELREKRGRARKLVEENRQLLEKAKNAPMFAKAPYIESLAEKSQELHELFLELI